MSVVSARQTVGEWFDPTSETFVLDPLAQLERARREAGSAVLPARILRGSTEAHVLTDITDITAALHDHRTFSSARAFGGTTIPERYHEQISPTVMGDSLIASDPPKHTRARRIANVPFRRGAVDALEDPIRRRALELIDGFAGRGGCALINDYSVALTFRTLTSLLGLPEQDIPLLMQAVFDHAAILTGRPTPATPPEKYDAAWTRWVDFRTYLGTVVDQRRVDPGEDLIGGLASARTADGAPAMDREEIITHVSAIVAAGADTTASTVANIVILLNRFPEARDELLANPALWPNAVEEGMRMLPALAGTYRFTTATATLPSGGVVPEGSRVYVSVVSANHDAVRFPHPDRFDLHRPNAKDHLALGTGRHVCLGAPLGRLQARVALEVLYERLPTLRLAPHVSTAYIPFSPDLVERNLDVVWD
ncbi:cytochrome P450 [Pseudonocardia alni]|uniref:cytochrome P450 n=1 Tax=Pseudonocardia alni TaxID=33907 RepID=UPI00332916DB